MLANAHGWRLLLLEILIYPLPIPAGCREWVLCTHVPLALFIMIPRESLCTV